MLAGIRQGTLVALAAIIFQSAFAQTAQPDFSHLAAQAETARAAGDAARAIPLYSQALQINPSWPDGWWYLGQMHYAANDYAEAVDAFTHFLKLQPDAAPATALRGLCEFELGEYEPSLTDVRRALALGAADGSRNAQILRYHEALLLTRLGHFEEALGAAGWFAKQNITNGDIDLATGLAMLRLPLLPADATPSQRQEAIAAGHAAFLVMAGGDAQGAADAFRQFFAQYPAAAGVHYAYGYLLYPTDQDAAIAEFQREIAVDPASPIAHTMLAWALLMENEPAAALPEARKGEAAAPTLSLAQLSLGRALLETGDVKSAMPVLETALAADPQDLEIHLALARAYAEAGRADDARRERLTCLKMTDRSAKPAPAMGQQEEPSAP